MRDSVLQAINEKAQQIADNAVPVAEKASDKLNKGAANLAANAEQKTDKMSAKANKTAQKVADNAVPKTDELIDYLQVLSIFPHIFGAWQLPGLYQEPFDNHRTASGLRLAWRASVNQGN